MPARLGAASGGAMDARRDATLRNVAQGPRARRPRARCASQARRRPPRAAAGSRRIHSANNANRRDHQLRRRLRLDAGPITRLHRPRRPGRVPGAGRRGRRVRAAHAHAGGGGHGDRRRHTVRAAAATRTPTGASSPRPSATRSRPRHVSGSEPGSGAWVKAAQGLRGRGQQPLVGRYFVFWG